MSKLNELGLFGIVPQDFEDEKNIFNIFYVEYTIGRVDLNDLENYFR